MLAASFGVDRAYVVSRPGESLPSAGDTHKHWFTEYICAFPLTGLRLGTSSSFALALALACRAQSALDM